ncbi:MAG: FAD-dependent oxidoreductase [Pseudomonadota bacterium]
MSDTDVLIIGAGLAGLSLAEQLVRDGRDIALLDARLRPGGRVLSEEIDGACFDLGPAWFWPGQPRMAKLTDRLGLEVFGQYAQGDLVFEDERGQVQRGRGIASMQGSYRLEGGISSLTRTLFDKLPQGITRLSSQVEALNFGTTSISARLVDSEQIKANQVVLALPPRLAAQIEFTPALPDNALQALEAIPTWMAGQAKIIAVYDTPFWRTDGLSGDAMSRTGPMVEIHDASPFRGPPYALFGFVGVPPEYRLDADDLRAQTTRQLERLFGPKAANPLTIHLKDWARDPFTACNADQKPLLSHPRYGMPPSLEGLWRGRLHFAGSEFAPEFGGFLEGALEAAEHARARLTSVSQPGVHDA